MSGGLGVGAADDGDLKSVGGGDVSGRLSLRSAAQRVAVAVRLLEDGVRVAARRRHVGDAVRVRAPSGVASEVDQGDVDRLSRLDFDAPRRLVRAALRLRGDDARDCAFRFRQSDVMVVVVAVVASLLHRSVDYDGARQTS